MKINNKNEEKIVPTGMLKHLKIDDVKPSRFNPRLLFDDAPLAELKESIRFHGVLVPITVYKIKDQEKYIILDGERRYRCCKMLNEEGIDVPIPANIVEPPTKVAGLIYMFSIHNFREQWDLVPVSFGLKTLMEDIGETDTKKLSQITGLGENQITRCKILLSYPEKYQQMSLDPEPTKRIPSNFWVELYPTLEIISTSNPKLVSSLGREALIDRMVEKYRQGKIKSIIHFRKIQEASVRSKEEKFEEKFSKRIDEFVKEVSKTIPDAFDDLVPSRHGKKVTDACDDFLSTIDKNFDVQYAVDDERKKILAILSKVKQKVDQLIQKLEGGDQK